jgi:hypothetical protein
MQVLIFNANVTARWQKSGNQINGAGKTEVVLIRVPFTG